MRQKRFRKNARPSARPQPTSDLIAGTFRWLKLDDTARSYFAMSAFAAAAGDRIGAHARGERLRGRILYVRCDSSAWTQHLAVMKAQLLERIRRAPGGAAVEDLRFNVGPLDEVAAFTPAAVVDAAPDPEPDAVPAPEVASAFEEVADEALRDRLRRLYARLGSKG